MTRYLYYFIAGKESTIYIETSTYPKFDNNTFANLEIPVPPLYIQEEIVRILDKFSTLTSDISTGLPAEIEARKKQYEYYRDKLLTFERKA